MRRTVWVLALGGGVALGTLGWVLLVGYLFDGGDDEVECDSVSGHLVEWAHSEVEWSALGGEGPDVVAARLPGEQRYPELAGSCEMLFLSWRSTVIEPLPSGLFELRLESFRLDRQAAAGFATYPEITEVEWVQPRGEVLADPSGGSGVLWSLHLHDCLVVLATWYEISAEEFEVPEFFPDLMLDVGEAVCL